MPTKLAGVGDRLRVTQLGTVLVIQMDGMGASPVTEFAFGNNYKDGRIKRSLAGALIHDANSVRDLQAGERVYLLKTEVKDTGVVFNVQSCVACDGSPADFDPDAVPGGIDVPVSPKGTGITPISHKSNRRSARYSPLPMVPTQVRSRTRSRWRPQAPRSRRSHRRRRSRNR